MEPLAHPNHEALTLLRERFGFDAFLPGQAEAIDGALGGGDVVVVMPTGSGKSLCYQLTALLVDGVTLVVSPLIALMKDQVDGLMERGLPATFINSTLTAGEMRARIEGMAAGTYKLVYVAPERFRVRSFMEFLAKVNVSMVAVDEAHCISQWGHDFRPDYGRLRQVVDALPKARIMALTATATPHVRSDIVEQLSLGVGGRAEPRELVYGFARPNLHLAVHLTATHDQKIRCIENTLKKCPTGIIYCATRKQTDRVFERVHRLAPGCGCYHAGMTDEARVETQERFLGGELDVVAATNAFGMGVDRADLRFVIHWDVPGSIEAYYQEIGRAGRDGENARCELLFNYADVRTQKFFIEGANPTRADVEAVWGVVRAACNHGPVTRSVEDWTTLVSSTKNEMTVRTVMAILERAHLIEREIGSGTRSYTTSLAQGADLAALEEQFPHMERKRRNDERKLKEMLRYVTTPRCRHAQILSYFGERDSQVPCGACDQCGPRQALATRAPNEEEWVVVQKILSCVARLDGRFGRVRITQVLRGSKEAALLERKLDQVPTYGLLADQSDSYVRGVMDELLRDGSLQLQGDEYPVVTLTPHGREVMLKKVTPSLAWPEPEPRASTAGSSKALGQTDFDGSLFDKLKAWRAEKARELKVPAYVILHDASLKAVAAACPGTHAELEALHGFGPSRIARYGDAILDLVDAHQGVASDVAEKKV